MGRINILQVIRDSLKKSETAKLNKHMHRIHASPTPLCPCGMGEQTAKHVLQECPEHSELRRKYWPSEASFKQKLYGNREELKTAVKFNMDTNLEV
ncbi:hypothetical protein BsWGS_28259 [Bradybaena similaris]